jgi:hypothetical protein
MGVTIELAGKQATLADGQWHSSEQTIQVMLNYHLKTLAIPAHYPPQDRERIAAQAAVRDFNGRIIRNNPDPIEPSSDAHGNPKVY